MPAKRKYISSHSTFVKYFETFVMSLLANLGNRHVNVDINDVFWATLAVAVAKVVFLLDGRKKH